MNIWYRVIVFGHNEHGFWNEPHIFTNYSDARDCFHDSKNNEEATGSFLIIQSHEEWLIVKEFETEGYYVSYGPLGTFSVRQNQLCTA